MRRLEKFPPEDLIEGRSFELINLHYNLRVIIRIQTEINVWILDLDLN